LKISFYKYRKRKESKYWTIMFYVFVD